MGKFGQNYRGDTFPKMRTRVEETKTHILPHFRAFSLRNMHKMGYKMSGPAVSERRGGGATFDPIFWSLKKSLKFSHFLKGFCRSKMRGKLANINPHIMRVLDPLGSTTGRCDSHPQIGSAQKKIHHKIKQKTIGGLPQCTVSSVDV